MLELGALRGSHHGIQRSFSPAQQFTGRHSTAHSLPLLALFLLSLGVAASAQIPSVTDVTATPTPHAGHDYIEENVETVNPASGSLSIRIGVPLPPSRGLSIPFAFAYDSGSVYFLEQNPLSGYSGFVWGAAYTPFSQGGWNYSVPMLSVQDNPFYGTNQWTDGYQEGPPIECHMWTDYVFQDGSGQRTDLGISFPENGEGGCNVNNFPGQLQPSYDTPTTGGKQLSAGATTLVSQVGSTIAATDPRWASEGVVNAVDVVAGDGTVYSFGSLQAPSVQQGLYPAVAKQITGISPPSTITDRNGNSAKLIMGTPGQPALNYIDTIGRTSLSISSFGAGTDTLTVSGLSQPYQVNWQSQGANFPITMTNLAAYDGYANCPATNGGGNEPVGQVISSITLPNGQQYGFTYDPTYGLIKKITYPTGAYVEYQWGLNSQSEFGQFVNYQQIEVVDPISGWGIGSYPSPTGACAWRYDAPAIQHRYVYDNGQNGQNGQLMEQQDFTYSTTWDPVYPQRWNQRQTTVVTQDLVQGSTFQTVYTYSSVSPDYQPNSNSNQSQIPVESSIQYYDTNGKLLRTVNKAWANQRLMTQQITTIANGQVSEADWSYNGNEMVTEKDEYDFGTGAQLQRSRGALLRKTLYPSYHSFSNPVDSLGAPQNILDRPDTVEVEDGSGNVKAGVSYTYDPAGNIVHRSDWLNQTGSSAVTTSHTYDRYGNMQTTTDPKTYLTTYSYADAFVDNCSLPSQSNAYVTKITYPTPTSGVAQIKTFQYHCATGELANSTNESKQVTSYLYNTPPSDCKSTDGLNRLSEIDYPDGGKTSYCYNDAPPYPTVQTTTLMTSGGQSRVSLAKMDGLGQLIQSQLSDPEGTVYVDTVYDGLGHVSSVSNPYRSTADPTYGLTTNTYDALGRLIKTVHPDNSSSSWCYDGFASTATATNCSKQLGSAATGTWVDATDENGNHLQRTSDALGRLTEVMELGSSSTPLSLETDYGYDTLNNLLLVKQKGNGTTDSARLRSFSYDALSRLVAATNSETASAANPPSLNCTGANGTWATCYGYDPNGNLTYKTDNRGVTTSISYDALNRVLSKTYSDGTTPTSCYQYDFIANGVGLMANAWTVSPSSGVSCSTATSFLTKRSITNYDAMGRIQKEQQFTLANHVSGYAPAYTYDLAGNLITSTSGVAPAPSVSPVLLTNTYNSAERLQTVTSNLVNNWISGAPLPITLFGQPSTQNTSCSSQAAQYGPFGGLTNASIGVGLTNTPAFTLNLSYDTRLRISCENAIRSTTTPTTPGSVVVVISGSEQTY